MEAHPGIIEEVKWRKKSNPDGVPVWSYSGILCTGETYKDKIKLTFFRGSEVEDPHKLLNSGSGKRRAIDLFEGSELNDSSFKNLIKSAVKVNIANQQ